MALLRRIAAGVCAAVLCAALVNPYIRGDGNGYYAYVRSLVIDRDLRFQNEFARGDPAFVRSATSDGVHFKRALTTKRGYIRNQWSVGASMLWAPFFLAAHALVKVTGHWPADGFSLPYRWACAFGTALYAGLGLLIARRVAGRVTTPRAATVASVAILGATSLGVYMFFLPFWALAVATLPAAALVALWSREPSWGFRRWAAYGGLVGLATTIHPVGIAWAALLAVAWLWDRGSTRERAGAALAAIAGFVVAEIPQLAIRAIAHGSPFDTGYGTQPWDFLSPRILKELFSAQHGLFSWTPVTLVAVIGLVLLARRSPHRRLGVGLLVTFVLMLYVIGANVAPEQSSFGNRMFVHFTPGFLIGTAAVLAAVWQRQRAAVAIALSGLVAWNALFAFQWAWGLLPKRGSVDWGVVAKQQVTTAPRELGEVVVRFFTDRDALIREVQERDEARISGGDRG